MQGWLLPPSHALGTAIGPAAAAASEPDAAGAGVSEAAEAEGDAAGVGATGAEVEDPHATSKPTQSRGRTRDMGA